MSEQTEQTEQIKQTEQTDQTDSSVLYDDDAKIMIVLCPHCKDTVIIEQLNCCIFRHGVFKDSGQQISPHAPKLECDNLFENNLIFGCSKPFQIVKDETDPSNIQKMKVVICEYI